MVGQRHIHPPHLLNLRSINHLKENILPEIINRFAGPYGFLSNFHVEADGKTVEHRFQAAKATNSIDHARIMGASTPGQAKGFGRHVNLRTDWEDVKTVVMAELVAQKFQNPELRGLLIGTGDAVLIEGNTWGDKYWGVDLRNSEGANILGITLMAVRASLR